MRKKKSTAEMSTCINCGKQFEQVGAKLRVAGGVACSGKCFIRKVDELDRRVSRNE